MVITTARFRFNPADFRDTDRYADVVMKTRPDGKTTVESIVRTGGDEDFRRFPFDNPADAQQFIQTQKFRLEMIGFRLSHTDCSVVDQAALEAYLAQASALGTEVPQREQTLIKQYNRGLITGAELLEEVGIHLLGDFLNSAGGCTRLQSAPH